MSAITQLNLYHAAPISASAAEMRALRVGVLVDLALTAEAGGHVKCWQRLAVAAVDYGAHFRLTAHFDGAAPRRPELPPAVRYVLRPAGLSRRRLGRPARD